MLSKLMKLAEEFNVAVFITNQVVADPGANAMFVAGILPHMFLLFTTLSSVLDQMQRSQSAATSWLTRPPHVCSCVRGVQSKGFAKSTTVLVCLKQRRYIRLPTKGS